MSTAPPMVAAALACMMCVSAAAVQPSPGGKGVLVAAAASLSDLAPQIAAAYRASGGEARFSFGGSNTLARQIIEGARIDVFISADEAQMALVERAGRLAPGTRVDLLGNRLKVVVSPFRRWPSRAFRAHDLTSDAVGHLAMGDPGAVPVGVYGRQWLERQGLWRQVAHKVVPLPSSPAVLAAVLAGRADAGIVYRTDGPQVPSALVVPLADAPRIVYPAAAIAGHREREARAFLTFLQSPAARRIFEAAGFVHLPR